MFGTATRVHLKFHFEIVHSGGIFMGNGGSRCHAPDKQKQIRIINQFIFINTHQQSYNFIPLTSQAKEKEKTNINIEKKIYFLLQQKK